MGGSAQRCLRSQPSESPNTAVPPSFIIEVCVQGPMSSLISCPFRRRQGDRPRRRRTPSGFRLLARCPAVLDTVFCLISAILGMLYTVSGRQRG